MPARQSANFGAMAHHNCFADFGPISLQASKILKLFSWAAMLRMTKVKLELITDVDMQMFIENRIRRGISTVAVEDTKKVTFRPYKTGEKTHRLNFLQTRCKLSRNDRMNDFEFR